MVASGILTRFLAGAEPHSVICNHLPAASGSLMGHSFLQLPQSWGRSSLCLLHRKRSWDIGGWSLNLPAGDHAGFGRAAGSLVNVNILSGLNATRHPVHKAAKPAPASQTSSAREHSACAIKPLKSVRGSPTRLSHHRDHRDNTRRITRLGKKPFPPEQIVPHVSAIARQA